MKCFEIDTSPDGKKFFVKISEHCMDLYLHYPSITTTWYILFARIFNLDYSDFLRMVRDIYGAKLIGKEKGYVYFYFEDKAFCQKFIKELERKFNLWKKQDERI